MKVKEYLQNNILIFDGAMGTYYAALMNDMSSNCEAANIDNPRLILDIHKEYIEAGARAIRTNTFGLDITEKGRKNLSKPVMKSLLRLPKTKPLYLRI